MSMQFPLADMFCRIRNGQMAKKASIAMPSSKLKVSVAKILKDEGFIQNYKVQDDTKQGSIRILLRYVDGNPVITGLKQVSKPGRRIYVNKTKVPRVIGGLGVSIVSTSRGIMTGEQSHKQGVGGEILCEIW